MHVINGGIIACSVQVKMILLESRVNPKWKVETCIVEKWLKFRNMRKLEEHPSYSKEGKSVLDNANQPSTN